MKSNATVIAAMIGGFLLTAATWVAAPILAPASRKVECQAGLHIERARRILHQYNAQIAYAALVRDQLRDAAFDVDLEDTSPIEDEGADAYEEIHTRLWEAFQPTDWGENPRKANANYGNVVGQAREGIRKRDQLASHNAALLDDAIAEAGEAINVSSGAASGRDVAEAHRMMAVALYHKALSKQLEAGKRRTVAERIRRQLLTLTRNVATVASSRTLATDSNIDKHIASVESAIVEAQTRLAQYESAAAETDDGIRSLEARLADAGTKADVAFNEMQRMQNFGVDFTDPQGAKNFTNKLMALADAYAVAVREAHIIEFGGYPHAEIDYTGDYIHGRYIQNGSPENVTMTTGLTHERRQRDILAEKIRRETGALEALRDDLDRLQDNKASYQQMETLAKQTIDETTPIATEAYDELNQVEAEAAAIEDQALTLLDQSISASKQAAALAGRWSSDAGSRLSSIAAEAKSNSAFNARSDDQWLAGFNNAQVADARLAQAAIFLARFKQTTRTAGVLETVTTMLALPEADPSAERAKAADARQSGVAAVTEAVALLERAHRTTGRHWTLVAQSATANEMLVHFDLNSYLADALTAYRNAIKGRENEPFSEPFARRIQALETR